MATHDRHFAQRQRQQRRPPGDPESQMQGDWGTLAGACGDYALEITGRTRMQAHGGLCTMYGSLVQRLFSTSDLGECTSARKRPLKARILTFN